jgi:predicted amidohydrolase YtcJ
MLMQADQLFIGGTVRTGVPGAPATSALAVAGGRVLALGRDALASRGPRTEVTDLAGGALLPSFGDGHVHPLLGGLGLRGVPVRQARSVPEILAAVAAWAAEHPDAEWVTGDAFDPTLAPGGRFDARWLDQVLPGRAVVLRTMDHHTMWVNSEALRRAGIDAGTPEPAAGQIVRRADGSPLGTLREWGAIGPVLDLLPAPGRAEQAAALAEVSALFAAAGITWVQDAWVDPDQVDAWLAAAADGSLRFRANLAFRAEPTVWKDQLGEFAADRDRVRATAPGWLTARTVKFFADGVVEAGTAALLQPYDDCPHSHGIANWTPDELADAIAAADAAGFQAHVHAIGDAGVRLALDAIAETARRNGPADRRPVMAHVQLIDPADLPRFAALGVIANLEPLWAQPDPLMTELTLPRVGAARGARQYQIATLQRTGARVSFGSDWPVTAYQPLHGIATAVTRQTLAGDPDDGWLPGERVSAADALAAYSAGVAYQAFEERHWGVLRPGLRADLVHLAADPAAAPARELRDLPVLGTWLAGARTH